MHIIIPNKAEARCWFTFVAHTILAGVLVTGACTPTSQGSSTNSACSADELIAVIEKANSTPQTIDIIELSSDCKYELKDVHNKAQGNTGLPEIISPIVINGNGATIQRSEINGVPGFRLFLVNERGSLTLKNVTIANGLTEVSGTPILSQISGGAIFNWGTLVLANCVLEHNQAIFAGGAIVNYGEMEINDSVIRDNIYLSDSFGAKGAAIYNGDAVAAISGSTINANGFFGPQGGEEAIFNFGEMEITNSTISGNASHALENEGIVAIHYSTIASNYGGVFSVHPAITIDNSILANINYDCVPGSTTMQGNNVDTDGSCGASLTIPVNELVLGPLQDNGGPTETHALLPGSPVLDKGELNCLATDQRGALRPFGLACDLGAFESTDPSASAAQNQSQAPTTTGTSETNSDEFLVIPKQDTNCREGCSATYFDIADTLIDGVEYVPLGADFTQGYFLFRGPSFGETCYVHESLLEMQLNGASAGLAAVQESGLVPNASCPDSPTLTANPLTATVTPVSSNGGGGGSSAPQCSDGIDNDGDGRADYYAGAILPAGVGDAQCTDANDEDESN